MPFVKLIPNSIKNSIYEWISWEIRTNILLLYRARWCKRLCMDSVVGKSSNSSSSNGRGEIQYNMLFIDYTLKAERKKYKNEHIVKSFRQSEASKIHTKITKTFDYVHWGIRRAHTTKNITVHIFLYSYFKWSFLFVCQTFSASLKNV